MRPIYSLTWIAALVVLSLVGCGGGSGSSITPPNPPPPGGQSSVSPASVTFGNTPVGTAPTWTVTYENDGSAPLAITAISTTGDYGQSNNCGNSLAAGAACTINVTFTPTASGAAIANLQIAGDSPQKVPLSGMGVTMHNLQVSWDASSSPVVGYFVYSSSQSGGPYTLLNASPSPLLPPSFPVSVQGGQTWYFVVTAVDAGGIESVPSNEVAKTLAP